MLPRVSSSQGRQGFRSSGVTASGTGSVGEENAEGASMALTQEVLPELSQMWKGRDWCIKGQLGSKGEAVCQG